MIPRGQAAVEDSDEFSWDQRADETRAEYNDRCDKQRALMDPAVLKPKLTPATLHVASDKQAGETRSSTWVRQTNLLASPEMKYKGLSSIASPTYQAAGAFPSYAGNSKASGHPSMTAQGKAQPVSIRGGAARNKTVYLTRRQPSNPVRGEPSHPTISQPTHAGRGQPSHRAHPQPSHRLTSQGHGQHYPNDGKHGGGAAYGSGPGRIITGYKLEPAYDRRSGYPVFVAWERVPVYGDAREIDNSSVKWPGVETSYQGGAPGYCPHHGLRPGNGNNAVMQVASSMASYGIHNRGHFQGQASYGNLSGGHFHGVHAYNGQHPTYVQPYAASQPREQHRNEQPPYRSFVPRRSRGPGQNRW